MSDLNPLTGKLYLEALQMTRVAREAYVLLGGKYPHPETIIPGGVTTTLNTTTLNEFYIKIQEFFDYAKKCIGIWDDIYDFLYEADPRYRDCGRLPATMIDNGQWDHEDHYDATYANCNAWGEKRWSTPGILIDGKLVSTRLTDINVGLEEFVEHSYYENWDDYPHQDRSARQPAQPAPPLEQDDDSAARFAELEGALFLGDDADLGPTQLRSRRLRPRLYFGARQEASREPLFRVDGLEPQVEYPQRRRPARDDSRMARPAGLERLRAQQGTRLCGRLQPDGHGRELGACAGSAQARRDQGGDALRDPEEGPSHRCRLLGRGRGFLIHHCEIKDGLLANYQIVTPSTVNACPRTPWGEPGPYEQAVLNTTIVESKFADENDFQGIDVLRAIRSFDPCMPCTTHVMVEGSDRVVTRDVTTCACGVH